MPPRLARLLAAVVAVAVVAGAFAVRGRLADDDEPTTTDGPGATTDADGDGGGGPYRLICDADLGEEACAAVADATGAEVETMTAGEVLADDGAAAESADLWLTLDPMAGVLDTVRRVANLGALTAAQELVAASSLAVLTFEGSELECLEPIAWACLVEPVRPGVAVPALDTSLGIVIAAAASASRMGSTDFSITTFRDTAEADSIEELISDSPGPAGDTAVEQADAMFRPGTASAVVTVAGLADNRAATPQGRSRGLRTATLFPPVTVGVVLAGLGSEGDAAVRALAEAVSGQTVRVALAEDGWAGEAGASNPLPAADLVYALQEDLSS